jgi:hypothetical protein
MHAHQVSKAVPGAHVEMVLGSRHWLEVSSACVAGNRASRAIANAQEH